MVISAGRKRLYLKISGASQAGTPVFILVHGLGVDHRYPLLQYMARGLSQRGTVIQFDCAGYGRSSRGLAYRQTSSFAQDILSVVRWVRQRADNRQRPLIVIGHSLGGLAAVLALSKLGNKNYIAAVVLLAVNAQPERLYQQYSQRGLLRQYKTESRIGRQRLAVDFWRDRRVVSPLQRAARITIPTLLIYGRQDHINPPSDGKLLWQAISSKHKKLVSLPTDHHFREDTVKSQVLRQIELWTKQYAN